ncbi:hypothetical protein J6590_079450 [Homalodisca vitripennis]|nr:hypothetical protein J6590_079450 [Homalodisca vitripennis]
MAALLSWTTRMASAGGRATFMDSSAATFFVCLPIRSCFILKRRWRSRRFRPSTTNTTSGAHGGIVQSRTEVDLILTDFVKDKREAIFSLPRKMLVKYTVGNYCQHRKSNTIFNNKKYTEENSV